VRSGVTHSRPGRVPADSARASVRLGLVLRSILVAPRVGFESALEASRRRARINARGSEGAAPFVLAAVGGASLMLLWLKLGGMADLRAVGPRAYDPGLLVAALVAGALVGLGAQWLWSEAVARVGGATLRGLVRRREVDPAEARGASARTDGASARELRLVWGAAAFPQVLPLFVLLPLDLVIVGPGVFATAPLSDSLSTAWAALSVALGVAIAMWSAFLFVRGVQVVTGFGPGRAGLTVVAAPVSLGLVAATLVAALSAAAGL
jgi:hypothetical protein